MGHATRRRVRSGAIVLPHGSGSSPDNHLGASSAALVVGHNDQIWKEIINYYMRWDALRPTWTYGLRKEQGCGQLSVVGGILTT